jgi:SAM-dependent methyltransferase
VQQLPDLPGQPHVLDLGCGSGSQTLTLASLLNGTIVAVDDHQPYVDQLTATIQATGLNDRIKVITADMFTLELPAATFDLIWAEGSIYIIGFERGLQAWRSWIKPGGYLAVTELTWLQPDPPIVVQQFWQAAYPAMQDLKSNLKTIAANGYHLIEAFPLPESAWWDDYYHPLEQRLQFLKTQYSHHPEALAAIAEAQAEIDLYRQFSADYGYVFYIMQT